MGFGTVYFYVLYVFTSYSDHHERFDVIAECLMDLSHHVEERRILSINFSSATSNVRKLPFSNIDQCVHLTCLILHWPTIVVH